MPLDMSSFLISPFNQSNVLDTDYNPESASGACHMFSLKWLSEIMANKSQGAATRMDTMRREAKSVQVMYGVFGKRWVREGGRYADVGMAKMLGVEVFDFKTPSSFADVASQVRSTSRTGFVYSFWFNDGGAHSIAVYRSGKSFWGTGHIYVFDPNFGEYYMKRSVFVNWLRQAMDSAYAGYGGIESHQLRYVKKYQSAGSALGGFSYT
ncbi:hypothetical protein L3Q72_05995 [Vibrio sp. JC009]|uniref:YopT-type cysteine protease domain-containing protein n=1 Tax=Vibrio sp. JC009 TaxID=2912314 RepID=UPI0023B13DD4|nr:YopT-type cysteine protease domain-containing protein [Vibrio sp. JC009]WED22943.1 hypothetical protein L3Q72_05995 [Vibrio sp. JC009]